MELTKIYIILKMISELDQEILLYTSTISQTGQKSEMYPDPRCEHLWLTGVITKKNPFVFFFLNKRNYNYFKTIFIFKLHGVSTHKMYITIFRQY